MELKHNNTYRNRRGGLVTVHRKFIERAAPFCAAHDESFTFHPDGRCVGAPNDDLVEHVRGPNAYNVQIKIEVVNDEGEPVNIKGHTNTGTSDFPLVTCTRAGEFETPREALDRLNKLHAVISPLKDL